MPTDDDYQIADPWWDFDPHICAGTIRWTDGAELFVQGEEAAEIDDAVEACETDEQVAEYLDQYRLGAWEPND